MILQQIVKALDAEMDRLQRLRAIVSGLQGSFTFSLDDVQKIAAPEQEADVPAKPRARLASRPVRVKEVRKPKAIQPKATPPHTALTGAIPHGPVVVSPAALASKGGAKAETIRPKQEKRPEPGSLGAMIRALHLDATA